MQDLETDGFTIIPGVFTTAEIAQLRLGVRALFDQPARLAGDFDNKGRVGSVRLDICARYPELQWLLFHKPLLDPLREHLGDDFVFLPEMSAHKCGYGSWHKDTTSQERAGVKFQWEPDYLMVEAAIYLQPNTAAYGGGLDVLPGSHRKPDTYHDAIDRNVLDKARTKLKTWGVIPTPKGFSIPNKAGDLVLFDFRLDHMATPKRETPPPESEKLSIFFACSRRNQHAMAYTKYISSRPDYQYLHGHCYPEALRARAAREGVNLLNV